MSRTGCIAGRTSTVQPTVTGVEPMGRTSVSEGPERSVAALAPETAMRSRSLRMLGG
jgi:hypothetical protein